MSKAMDGCEGFDAALMETAIAGWPTRAVEAHVSGCPRCARALDRYRRAAEAILRATETTAPGPVSGSPSRLPSRATWAACAALAACAAILASIILPPRDAGDVRRRETVEIALAPPDSDTPGLASGAVFEHPELGVCVQTASGCLCCRGCRLRQHRLEDAHGAALPAGLLGLRAFDVVTVAATSLGSTELEVFRIVTPLDIEAPGSSVWLAGAGLLDVR